ncbi:hypothetical protein [Paraburkholderia caribensis]|uniref:hypothetical protein n=1 Tax=Paraburkholderia caribensis TaxID=75105 RepID=UPI000720ED4E|nr:hypothetical protein [Paraburkholderia caribensis]ALP61366.1 hypothetical protein AN416_01345 [Paraburkholderia caribensis]AUT50509.1 hypothetical protein C2L66_00685 [Paraburkholderia caribensis]
MNEHPNYEVARDQGETANAIFTPGTRGRHPHILVTLMLALLTTMTSVDIAIMSGLQRAVGLPEQVACVALAVAPVIGAHLLPALSTGKSIPIRCFSLGLCAASLLVTLYGQVSFFLLAQRNAGNQRADTVTVPHSGGRSSAVLTRDVMAIASDEENIRNMLAINDSKYCGTNCLAQRRRHDLLEARLRMIETEEHEAKRHEVAADRDADVDQRWRDSMRDDPATARLARATGRDEQTLNLLLALVCAAVLDFTGSFCWYLVLDRRRSTFVVHANPVVALNDRGSRGRIAVDEGAVPDTTAPLTDEGDSRLMQLVHDVAAGEVRPTIDGIREHFNCAQKTATQLRRRYQALCELVQSSASQS